jgi:hypothetical protein
MCPLLSGLDGPPTYMCVCVCVNVSIETTNVHIRTLVQVVMKGMRHQLESCAHLLTFTGVKKEE